MRRGSKPRRQRCGAFVSGDPPWPGGGPDCLTPLHPVALISRGLAGPLLSGGRGGPKTMSDGPKPQSADLGRVNGGGTPRLPWVQVPSSKLRVEVLNAVLANGGRGEVREGHGQRNVRAVMHPVRRVGGYVHGPPWRHGVRGGLRLQVLDPPVGAVPVSVELAPSSRVTLEAPDADGLAAADLHQQAVLDVEVDRRDRIWGGNKDECHPFAHLDPLAPLGAHPRLELVELSVH